MLPARADSDSDRHTDHRVMAAADGPGPGGYRGLPTSLSLVTVTVTGTATLSLWARYRDYPVIQSARPFTLSHKLARRRDGRGAAAAPRHCGCRRQPPAGPTRDL